MYKILCDDTEIEYKSGNIQYTKNNAAILTFIILANSQHFNKLKKFQSYIRVINAKTNEIEFDGRVIDVFSTMDNNGTLSNTLTCEYTLNYLNDTRVDEWGFYPLDIPEKHLEVSFANSDTKSFITKVLEQHNSKVDEKRKIYLGNIELNEKVLIETRYETSLASIQANICSKQDGYLVLRYQENKYFLDFLKNTPIKDIVSVDVGINMSSMAVDDEQEVFSRIIPLGQNNLTIKSVNNNIPYIQSDELVERFGVIETVISYPNITMPENLILKARETLEEVKYNNKLILEALDLSYINSDYKHITLNMPVHVINKMLNYDKIHEVVSLNLNLVEPWKSQFNLNKSNKSIVNTINSVEQKANENKIEIVSLANELITKVSEGDLSSIVKQNATSWGLSINGNLESKNYKFDNKGFWIAGNNGGCELTDTYATWKDKKGNEFTVGASGFFKKVNGVYGDIKYFSTIIRRSNLKNGAIEYFQLPKNFIGKKIDKDFSVTCMWDAIDSNQNARFKKDALRNIFIKVVNYNSRSGVLAIQPCIQKIGLETKTFFGYDSNSTTAGNPIGEGSMDVVLIINM